MVKKYMNKNILILLFPLIVCGCNSTSTNITPSTSLYLGEYGDIMNDFLPNEGEVKLLFKHSEEETVGDDGEDYFYNYCPSIFIEDNVQHVYYCTNKDEGNVTDYVGYRTGQITNNKLEYSSETKFVLSHGENGSWDSRHACDPSVIKGEFKFHGEQYSYLMAYLGCVPSDCTLNETGIAVSKTPEGPWVKCDFKVDGETKINPIV